MLVAKGFQQVHGIDYVETFAPLEKMDSICLALSIAATQGLNKSLYGLNQAPRAWTHDFLIILVLYMDDLLITGSSASTTVAVKRTSHDKLLMMDMGPLCFFLGLQISKDTTGIKLSHAKYAWELLKGFHITDYKPAPTPFLSGVCLQDGGDTPLVDSNFYCHLVGSLL
eukprot:PITA_03731